MWVAVPVTRPTVLASRIAHPCRNEQRRSPHLYVNVSMYLPLKKANTWHALYIPMSIYNCFVFDKGSEFARLQTVKEQSAIVDTFPYMYPHPSASAFASVSEQRRCKGTHFHRIMMHFLVKNALLYIK